MTSKNESEDSANPGLNELRRKWRAGYYAIDKDSVCGIEESITDAGRQLEDGLARRGHGGDIGLMETMSEPGPISGEAVGAQFIPTDFVERPRASKDPLPHRKVCRLCNRTARNDHCEECYNMVREAASYVPEGRMLTSEDVHPCAICQEAQVLTPICPECMDLLLGL